MKKNSNLKVIIGYIVLIIILSTQFVLLEVKEKKEQEKKELARQEQLFNDIKASYNTYVKTNKEAPIYKLNKDKYVKYGTISKETNLFLEEKKVKDYKDIYFKLKDLDFYVSYKDVEIIEEFKIDNRYKNYIPFNQNIVTKKPALLYSDDGNQYSINDIVEAPIIIKETDRYYIEYANRLLYVKTSNIEKTVDSNNSSNAIASQIAVILYHYVYNDSNASQCSNTVICHSISQVRSHFDYLKQNNFHTTNLKDMELWLDGKIQLPKNSVTITIDDGWFLGDMIGLLTEYQYTGTLFLITSLAPVWHYNSDYLELHSHTDNMHYTGKCTGGQGSPIKCLPRQTILDDLAKSRQALNNTTYFSWPFYEYNDYSMKLLKEAGFTMAFKGGMYKATQGINKFLVPRYTIQNTTSVATFASYVN